MIHVKKNEIQLFGDEVNVISSINVKLEFLMIDNNMKTQTKQTEIISAKGHLG